MTEHECPDAVRTRNGVYNFYECIYKGYCVYATKVVIVVNKHGSELLRCDVDDEDLERRLNGETK